jgi:hypothetical protein
MLRRNQPIDSGDVRGGRRLNSSGSSRGSLTCVRSRAGFGWMPA